MPGSLVTDVGESSCHIRSFTTNAETLYFVGLPIIEREIQEPVATPLVGVPYLFLALDADMNGQDTHKGCRYWISKGSYARHIIHKNAGEENPLHMQWFRKQNTFLRVFITLALIMPVILIPMFSVMWMARNAHASQASPSGLPRPHSATSIFGPSTGKHAHQIYPASAMPGRKFPGVAGHAARAAGRAVPSAHFVHTNNAFAANVVASSDATPAPFGPQPRNGPQAAVDPTNANHIVLVYND